MSRGGLNREQQEDGNAVARVVGLDSSTATRGGDGFAAQIGKHHECQVGWRKRRRWQNLSVYDAITFRRGWVSDPVSSMAL